MSGTLPEWAKNPALNEGEDLKRLASRIVATRIVDALDIDEATELVGNCDDILDYLWCDSADQTPEQIAERVQAWRESIVERAESAVTDIINRSKAA